MCRTEKLRDVPHVAVLRRHVEIAAHDHGLVRRSGRHEVVAQAAEPLKLEVVLLAGDGATVRHIDARDANPPQIAVTMRHSSIDSAGSPQKPTRASSSPTRDKMATPFQRPLP